MIGQTRRSSRRGLSRLPKTDAKFRYEIVNLAVYGESALPTDDTIWDLRIIHRYPDGNTVEFPLYDVSGVRQIDLDSASVLLRTDNFELPKRGERVEVAVTGKIRPAAQNAPAGDRGADARISAPWSFTLESIVVPGLYEVLSVTDDHGERHPIGAFGLLPDDRQLEVGAFSERRKSARNTALRVRSNRRLEQPSRR